MSKVLELLLEGTYLSTAQMGQVLGLSAEQIEAELVRLQEEKILLGLRPVFHPDDLNRNNVRALIEVKINPEREGGFDRIAQRISKFPQVESCYLMSGAYDLLVVVKADNLRNVAQFVFEKLASINGVNSTATHFMLRAYKEQGYLLDIAADAEARPAVSP